MKDRDIQERIEKIKDKCHFDFIKIAFLQNASNTYEIKSVYGSGNNSKRYLRIILKTGKGVAGQALKTGRPVFIVNVDEEIKRKNLHHYPIIMAEGLKSIGAIPLYEESRVIGVVVAGFRSYNKMTDELIDQFNHRVTKEFSSLFKEMVKK